ncbi:hypothetical protein Dsin_023390 [Dipteronia sinensis]|uniref:Potassium channel domain-containing protein n=1 Tax=Dipteronia sinensis TaxID=43782 RepID=A0AAE0E0M5_9ROSI|nr:hypothetical protein Dsin_023390 [Dipteronia sinensis]
MDTKLCSSNGLCSCPFSLDHLAMASNGAGQSLLPTHQTKNANAPPKRRGFRRCKSAPLVVPDMNGNNEKPPIPKSVFGKLHSNFKWVPVYLAVYLALGTICFFLVEKDVKGKKTNAILDSLYFCIVTMTTVGYGDLVPGSNLSKLLACAFVFSGMALGGLIVSKGADYLVEKQEILLVKALHINQKVGPSDIMKEIETNKVRYKFFVVSILLLVLFLVGTIVLIFVEEMSFVDAFYCVCTTVTTLGYGDQSFKSKMGRIFAVFWILTSTVCLAQFFLYIAELNTEKRQRALVEWVLNRKVTNFDLEAADINDDGVVDAAEFVIYKLKEMGKINQEDINQVMKEFEELDVDQSGTLSTSDIILAQSSPPKK